MMNCSSPTKDEPKDLQGPALTIDSMFAGAQAVVNGDTVSMDMIIMKGHVSDTSGIYSMTVSIGGTRSSNITFTSALWNATVYLRSGSSAISIEAQDRADNKSTVSKSLYYKTDYFPVDDSSYWKFNGAVSAADTVLIKTDTSGLVIGTRKYYGVTFANGIVGTSRLWIYPKDNVFYVDSVRDSVIDSKDTLFCAQYTPQSAGYSGKTERFIGDTTIAAVQYRNCVKITLGTGKMVSGISAFVLAPYKGFVGVEANAKGYPLSATNK
jgi:hypothetical protein